MDHERRILFTFTALTIGCLTVAALLPRLLDVGSEGGALGLRDLSAARTVEIRDDVERVVLRGNLEALASTTVEQLLKVGQLIAPGGEAVGKAEIELTRQLDGALVQEVEIDIGGVTANTQFAVFIDGARVGGIRTNGQGVGEMEHFGRVRTATQTTD